MVLWCYSVTDLKVIRNTVTPSHLNTNNSEF